MPSTPEPHSTRTRARTPPTPLHGPQHDTYEPYSPRRSSRAASHRNPYGSSSANLNRSTPPPPTTTKRARFAVGTTQLNSPPASPRHHKTPRNNRPTAVKATNSLSDSDNNTPTIGRRRVAAHHSLDPTTMLPTPSKTPQTQQKKKKNATVLRSTARILHFPSVPGDGERRCRVGFELDSSDEDTTVSDGKNKKKRKEKEKSIPIYTDPNARVPERDEREVNPFLGPAVVGGASSSSRKKRGIARGKEEEMEEEEMEERVRRKEGMVYVFRGKKIFRPYTSASDDDNEHDIPAGTQRTLRRQAGATAARPLTRSSLQPRLLFPSETQRRDREVNVDVDDEEALTDIDSAVGQDRVSTPPSTSIAPSGNGVVESEEVGQEIRIYEDDVVRGRDEGGETMTTSPAATAKGRKKKAARGGVASPFDSWPRTKVGRKRAGDEVVSEVTKRMRSGGGGGTFAGR